ncbi:MAG: TadE/TadG family type IV pilus assembly protein [Terriglobales bacterium]
MPQRPSNSSSAHPARARSRRSAGTALAEFAIAAPILLTVLLGVVQMGWALYTYHFVASAARQAARYAIVRGADCSSWTTACPAGASDIQNFVTSLAPGAIDTTALTVTTAWTPNNSPGNPVKVTVTYTYNLDIPFIPAIPLNMQSESQMVISQ